MSIIRAYDDSNVIQVGQDRLHVCQPLVVVTLVIVLELRNHPREIGAIRRDARTTHVRRTCLPHVDVIQKQRLDPSV